MVVILRIRVKGVADGDEHQAVPGGVLQHFIGKGLCTEAPIKLIVVDVSGHAWLIDFGWSQIEPGRPG